MIERIEEFAQLLRKNGVRVSTAEVIDATRAVDAVGVERSKLVRAALGASLIKRPDDRGTFDELFSLYFMRGRGPDLDTSPMAEMMDAAGLSEDAARELMDQLADQILGMGAVARAGTGMGSADVGSMIRAAGDEVDLSQITTPLQVGFYAYRVIDALGVRDTEDEIAEMLRGVADSAGLSPEQFAALREYLRQSFARLRQAVREYVDAEFRRNNLNFMQELAVRALSDKPLAHLTEAEIADLRAEVKRLARILRARVSLKAEVKKRGRLDLRRTLRRSLTTGGVPFDIIRRERQKRKPRLVVLCDISDSVRNVSRFMLQFVYTLAELFDRVYSFAFVAEIGELTDLFRRHDLDRAVKLAYSGDAVNVFANSNYGHALEQFAERHMDKITPRTTVLVIGDGRNNYHASNAQVLATMQRRAKQVWWLNPESPAAWGFGDSAMHEYAVYCDRVVVAHNLDSLKGVVDTLVM
jgi:hypothetical protein